MLSRAEECSTGFQFTHSTLGIITQLLAWIVMSISLSTETEYGKQRDMNVFVIPTIRVIRLVMHYSTYK